MPAKRLFKILFFGISLLLVSPAILLARIEQYASGSETVFALFAQLLSLVPGKPGNFLRSAYYFGALERCSWEVDIGFGSILTHRGSRVSRNVSTGSFCVIGHANIGDDVRMGSRVSIPSGKRQHLDETGQLSDATNYERVSIGAHCWIGEAAVIMANVGESCIVSAGAIVIHAIPADSIAGGNPAAVIKPLAKPQSNELGK